MMRLAGQEDVDSFTSDLGKIALFIDKYYIIHLQCKDIIYY